MAYLTLLLFLRHSMSGNRRLIDSMYLADRRHLEAAYDLLTTNVRNAWTG